MSWLHTTTPSTIAFYLGAAPIAWYGLLVAVAVIVGFCITRNILHKKQVSDDHIYGLFFWLLLVGIIGGRIGHLIGEWDYYAVNLGEIIKIWNGGLAIHGALIAGLLATYVYTRVNKLFFWPILDAIVIVTPLMQAIGRWGNYANQELFGLPSDQPWSIPISLLYRPVEYVASLYFHPLFLYESIAMLVLFVLIFSMYKKNVLQVGQYTLLYLIGYSVVRFMLDFLRIDMLEIGPLLLTQWVGMVIIIVASMMWRKLGTRRLGQLGRGTN